MSEQKYKKVISRKLYCTQSTNKLFQMQTDTMEYGVNNIRKIITAKQINCINNNYIAYM